MRLDAIIATPHPDGYRIDLSWRNPEPVDWPGIRVVRREGTHPTAPDDGVVVANGTDLAGGLDEQGHALYTLSDTGLRGGVVYYYSLFPFRLAPPEIRTERSNRVAALAGSSYDMTGQMMSLLPAIYHRYDAGEEQLRRYLSLPGGQLDLLRTFAEALLDAHDVAAVNGTLLPLLAQWIGWKTDYRREVETQRNEIRHAPSIYQRVGMIPVVGATVKRISGWESRAKEFTHNVARSNKPERLNLWARRLDAGGVPAEQAALFSVNYAYDGRPASAEDADGVRWVFYHTPRRDHWRIWHKTAPTFQLGLEARTLLDAADMAGLQPLFAALGVALADDATVTTDTNRWHIDDATNGETYVVEDGRDGLTVYHTSALLPAMAPSRPFTASDEAVIEKHPAVALQQDTLWVFWAAYDPERDRWEIRYRTRREGAWADDYVVFDHGMPDATTERKAPAVAVDPDDGLWLFWLERTGDRPWRLRYNRYPDAGLGTNPPDANAWEIAAGEDFPPDGPADARVEDDVSVVVQPDDPARPLWVFWARKEPSGDPRQTRWTVAYRSKASLDPSAIDWDPIEMLPKDDPAAHDREPVALANADGSLLVFWSGNRGGDWAVWRATLSPGAPDPWSAAEAVTEGPYAQRAPLPVADAAGLFLLHRSSESLRYHSAVYRATETVDFRYAGSITVHTRDLQKLDLRTEFDDFLRYTYDTGPRRRRTNADWYARDTLGIYLRPDTANPGERARGVERVRRVLPEFMPLTDRAVLIVDEDRHTEYVYTYDRPASPEPRFVTELYQDVLDDPLGGQALGPGEDFNDELS